MDQLGLTSDQLGSTWTNFKKQIIILDQETRHSIPKHNYQLKLLVCFAECVWQWWHSKWLITASWHLEDSGINIVCTFRVISTNGLKSEQSIVLVKQTDVRTTPQTAALRVMICNYCDYILEAWSSKVWYLYCLLVPVLIKLAFLMLVAAM